MQHPSLDDFLRLHKDLLTPGPVAMIFAEDPVEIASTLDHHLRAGFRTVLFFAPREIPLPEGFTEAVHHIVFDTRRPGAVQSAVTSVIEAAPGTWLYYCFNAEYLFFPFCETRNVRELLAFHTEERRDAMLTYVIDLYAPNLAQTPNAVDLSDAMLDRSGYFALAREDAANHYHPKDRQLDFYGGLRWRFEEHVPVDRRKIDRISLFRAKPGLRLRPAHTFSDEEYNTYSCPWHHNLTAVVASFRVAKALKRNPGSSHEIQSFMWHNSVPFAWNSQQLMDLGLMEPGQWF